MEKVQAAVRTGPGKIEIREFPMPDIADDAALMKMEVAGICGTDVKLYQTPPSNAPVIMGHENIGTIAKAGREFTRRKGFKEGDLVFVEHYVMCGKCEWCHLGQYRTAKTPTGAQIPTGFDMATPPLRRHRTCGAASRSTYTCRGTPSCTACRRT